MTARPETTEGLVSVVMPFLNTPRRYLREAVESIRNQSYPHWELILIDDGSTERVGEYARGIAETGDSLIRYFDHPDHRNLGSSASRNLGIRAARGQYIAFLDADDVWIEAKLEEQVAILERHPEIAMVYGNTCYWHSWAGNPETTTRDFSPRLGLKTPQIVKPPRLLQLSLEGRIAVPSLSSVIIRREALATEDWFEEHFSGMYDDQVLYAKVWVQHPVYISERCWDKYRQHAQSMTAGSRGSEPHRQARLAYLEWLTDYLVAQSVMDERIRSALRVEIRALQGSLTESFTRRCRRVFWRLVDSI